MKGNNPYKHITKAGYDLMDSIPTGSLLRVKWIEDPDDVDGAEWGTNLIEFDDLEPDEDINNVVLLLRWRPEIENAPDVISFDCLWGDKIYSSSTYALIEVVKE